MKTIKIIILIICYSTLNSCNKVEKGALTHIEGDYYWAYTKLDDFSYTTNEETPDQYGARITSKNKLILFKNGEQISKHKIVNYTPNANGSTSNLQIKTKEFGNIVYSNGDTLRTQNFPYDVSGGHNYFIKKL